jgi:hypothetical protein
VLDLTDRNVRNQLGLNSSELLIQIEDFSDAHRMTQEIGEIAQSLGFDALKVRSAQYEKGINIVILST